MQLSSNDRAGWKRALFWLLLILAVGLNLGATPKRVSSTELPPLTEANPATTPCRLPERPAVRPGSGAQTLPVLIYHHLAPASLGQHKTNPMVLTVEAFTAQMDWLRAEGYYTPTLQEVEGFVAGQLELPRNSVLLTFDDGYESNYRYAHPVLCAAGLRAVLYRVGNREPNPDRFDPAKATHLTWPQAWEMQQSGVWAIENHTFDGHDKVKGQAPLLLWTGPEIEADLARLDELWRAQGLPAPSSIAYPFGAHGQTALAAVKKAGLRTGFTTEEGRVKPGMDPHQLPRLAIFPYHSFEQFKRMVRGGPGA